MKKLLVVFLSLMFLSQPVLSKPPHLEIRVKDLPDWYVLKWNARPGSIYQIYLTKRKLYVVTMADSIRIPRGLFCAEIVELKILEDQSLVTGYGKVCKI